MEFEGEEQRGERNGQEVPIDSQSSNKKMMSALYIGSWGLQVLLGATQKITLFKVYLITTREDFLNKTLVIYPYGDNHKRGKVSMCTLYYL